MQFEIMNMPNPPIAPAKEPDFNANNEVDFPTLESTVKKGPSAQSKAEKPVERAIAVEQKSFANIAAKPPEAIIAKQQATTAATTNTKADASTTGTRGGQQGGHAANQNSS